MCPVTSLEKAVTFEPCCGELPSGEALEIPPFDSLTFSTMKNAAFFLPLILLSSISLYATEGDDLIARSGVPGGLLVHVGCDSGDLTVELGAHSKFIIQGLESDPNQVERARGLLAERDLHGRVLIQQHIEPTTLPYANSLVNLLILEEDHTVPREEVMRVIAPRGVLMERQADGWKKTIKPVPGTIDEWGHFLHNSSNNAVSKDSELDVPRSLRWDCGPMYSRSHEMDASVAAAVTESGRFYSVVDKGPAGTIGKNTPDKWVIEARDAFSGVLLWENSLTGWGWRTWKPELEELKPEEWGRLIAQRRFIPSTLVRRVVAAEGDVFVTVDLNGAICRLDGATGELLDTYTDTKGADECVIDNGVLYATVRPKLREISYGEATPLTKVLTNRGSIPSVMETGVVKAIDLKTGKLKWESNHRDILPYTLTASGDRVYYHTGEELIAVNTATGETDWQAPSPNFSANRWDSSNVILAHDEFVIIASKNASAAFDRSTGESLWESGGGRKTAFGTTPVDAFIIDDLLWFTSLKGEYSGHDPATGEVVRTIEPPTYFLTPGHHLRCYRAKATERYILDNKRGIEFMDVQGENHQKHDWVRGMCRLGIIPSNGMTYTTPTPCSCYQTVQLKGFNALSSELPPAKAVNLLVKGPAYDDRSSEPGKSSDWSMHRANSAREGIAAEANPGPDLQMKWAVPIGGELTQPVTASGRIFVCSRERCQLVCLDKESGEIVWQQETAAQVDSTPTYHNGFLLFGCRDGWFYKLRASDGALAWRFRGAPSERQIVSYNRLESSWPINGSALVLEEKKRSVVYLAAGRNTNLDGGIHLFGLDVDTGKVLYSNRLSDEEQDEEKAYHPHQLEGAQPDLLLFDGTYISMQSQVFDRNLKLVERPATRHIFASGGFLDDRTWHRNFWTYTTAWPTMNKNASTFPNVGQVLLHDGDRCFGQKYFTVKQGQSMVVYPETTGYYLFCDRDTSSWDSPLVDLLHNDTDAAAKKRRGLDDEATKSDAKKAPAKKAGTTSSNKDWEDDEARVWGRWIPVRARAIAAGKGSLFVTGTEDKVPEADPLAPFEGRGPGVMSVHDTATGEEQNRIALDSPPVFDGVIAVDEMVLMSLEDGQVQCWE